MEEIIVRWITDPTLYRYGVVYYHSVNHHLQHTAYCRLTFMEYIAHRTVVQNHDFTEIGLDLAEVFDVGSIA